MGGLFGIALIIGVVVLMQRNGHGRSGRHNDQYTHQGTGEKNALRILEERYAKGEIDQDTFRKMKSDLEEV